MPGRFTKNTQDEDPDSIRHKRIIKRKRGEDY